jgi:TatD DNase family protein
MKWMLWNDGVDMAEFGMTRVRIGGVSPNPRKSGRGQTVLHWFTGTKAEARRAVELGCYFSVNAQMLETDKGRDLVGILPNDRLLTETDGPFTKFGGRPACPADVADTLIELAKLRQIPLKEMAATIKKNLTAILSVAP